MNLFLGVDGGGTHTRARLCDDAGRVLGEGEAGPGNVLLPGGLGEVLTACLRATEAAGLSENEIGQVHAGMGLAGTHQDVDRKRAQAMEHPFAAITVETDAYASWLGAFGGRDGAILILGTGSAGFAAVGGQRLNIGGTGAQIGDDGSGAAMGRLAIRRSLWALDGMVPRTPFAESVLADFDGEAQNATLWAVDATPAAYAAYAPRVFDFAEAGDELALGVLQATATDASMLARRLVAAGAAEVAMIGGLFPRIKSWMDDDVKGHMTMPEADAVDGAILLARQRAGAA